MPRATDHNVRILAIDPSPRGFGFAVLEGPRRLLDWGVAELYSKADEELLARVEALVDRYRVTALVLENIPDDPRRHRSIARVAALVSYCRSRHLPATLVSREDVRTAFSATGSRKHEIAVVIATMFPELAPRLPPKRTLWASEDERMNIFDAVSFALAGTSLLTRPAL
jgi:hypothetical protein